MRAFMQTMKDELDAQKDSGIGGYL
jgi:hypothetical protein